MDKQTMNRARGCMVAAGYFFKKGYEDISQTIDLGLQLDKTPQEVYQICQKRNSADKSVLAMTSLIIFFMVRDCLTLKKASLAAWRIAEEFHDNIGSTLANAVLAIDRKDHRGRLVAQFLTSDDLKDKLSLAIYINLIKMDDTFFAHLQEIKKHDKVEMQIMAAAFAGAFYGLEEVNSVLQK